MTRGWWAVTAVLVSASGAVGYFIGRTSTSPKSPVTSAPQSAALTPATTIAPFVIEAFCEEGATVYLTPGMTNTTVLPEGVRLVWSDGTTTFSRSRCVTEDEQQD
jgi:hypothetical protein